MKNLLKKYDTVVHATPAPAIPAAPDVQRAPVELVVDDAKVTVKVDHALLVDDQLLVAGWVLGDARPALDVDGHRLTAEYRTFAREDVSRHFALSAGAELGFVLVAQVPPAGVEGGMVGLRFGPSDTVLPVTLSQSDALSADDFAQLGPAKFLLARAHEPFSPAWRELLAAAPLVAAQHASGYLEFATSPAGLLQVVVCGWTVVDETSHVWLEDDQGGLHTLGSASWRARPDVYAAIGGEFGPRALHSGFIVRLEVDKPIRTLRMLAVTEAGVHQLAEIAVTRQSGDPAAFSRWLFGISAPEGEMSEHAARIDTPVLEALIAGARAAQAKLPVVVRQMGDAVAEPVASIIVPLYGRIDFVESQMLEWVRDSWIRRHAELIYVLDDPALVEPFRHLAGELHRLYGIPFRWIWGGANRGFSGANNLGAAQARGKYLLFLNSDVFPQKPGWLQALIEVLANDAGLGAVAPRLTFAEGGIQHAGMRFRWMDEYGVWINQHPFLGLDTALDPATSLTRVPAVTGACLLMRRDDFEAVGGWDTGYLIGDFEDSDLCLKLRERGMAIAYDPRVQLTHLERQSMTAIGGGEYRLRVTLWNAMRHQRRWRSLIETPVEPSA